jgi:hypothetical protein
MLNILLKRYHIPCLIFKTALIINTNAETILTVGSAPPHPFPLPTGERERVRGANLKEFNAFALVATAKVLLICLALKGRICIGNLPVSLISV